MKEIRGLFINKKLKQCEIARMFEISTAVVHYVVRNKTWKHLL